MTDRFHRADPRRALTGILIRALSARLAARQISTEISELFVGAQGTCARCGDLVVWKELSSHTEAQLDTGSQALVPVDAPHNVAPRVLDQHSVRFWSDCTCWLMACDRAAALSHAGSDAQAGMKTEPHVSDVRLIQQFSFANFDPAQLNGGAQLVRAAQRWLERIDGKPIGNYHDTDGPAVCLYFYSQGKGRGKTHLASAIAMDAYLRGKLVAFADEVGFLDRYWSVSLEQQAALTSVPSSRAWLTVLDGMGDRENTPASLRDAWYALINPRWLKCGWTIVTSNYTPAELLDRGTIDDRSYSRLMQMCRGKWIEFVGDDQRLKAAA